MLAKRLLAMALLTLAVSTTALVVSPPAAMAAGSCTWDACNGKDPQTSGCASGATTVDSFTSPVDGNAYVELRYSPSCHAAWSRLTTGAAGEPSHSYLTLNVYASSSGGSPLSEYWKKVTNSTNDWGSGQVYWSYMNSYGNWTQACLKDVSDVGPCTGRH